MTKFYISRQPTTTLLPFLGLKPWAKYMALAKKKDDSNSLFFFLLFFLIGDFFFIHLHYQTCCRLGKEKRLLTYLQKIYIWEKWRSPLVQKPNYETPFHRCAFTSFRVLLRDRAGLVAQRIRAHGCEPPSQGFESLIFATFFFFFWCLLQYCGDHSLCPMSFFCSYSHDWKISGKFIVSVGPWHMKIYSWLTSLFLSEFLYL